MYSELILLVQTAVKFSIFAATIWIGCFPLNFSSRFTIYILYSSIMLSFIITDSNQRFLIILSGMNIYFYFYIIFIKFKAYLMFVGES